MSLYDEYFTNEDKPYAENLNDALLVSNFFDLAIPIVLPDDFSNGAWVDTNNKRKCHVSIVQVTAFDNLNVTGSSLTGSGVLAFRFYPNFNSFGKIRGVDWTGSVDEVTVNDANGNLLCSVTEPGNLPNVSGLKTLQNFEIIVKVNGELEDLTLVLENKLKSARYTVRATVEDIDGLSDALDAIETVNNNQDLLIDNKVDKERGKGLSTNNYTDTDKSKVDHLKTVATTGSYNDLDDKPTIPTKTSELANDGADGTNVYVSNNDSRLSNARTPTAHTHGSLSNDGKIGTASGKIIMTGTGGLLQAVDTITKAKISDFPSTMPPSSHTHTKAQISDFPTTMTPSAHAHGSLSNTGTLNSDISSVNKVAVTDSSNNLKTIAKLPFANLNITKANITGLGIPSQDTTYAVVNANANGLMSSTDKSKLDGIATGATKNVIDTALSSTSTNAVQNKVINAALAGKASSSHTHTKSQITDFSHTHDDRYFTESEMNTKLALKQDKSGLAWTPIKLANDRIILYYNDYYCSLEINGAFTPTVANAWTNLTGSTLDSAYRPATPVTTFNDGNVLIRFKVNSEGTIQYYSPQTFSSASTLRAVLNWVRH